MTRRGNLPRWWPPGECKADSRTARRLLERAISTASCRSRSNRSDRPTSSRSTDTQLQGGEHFAEPSRVVFSGIQPGTWSLTRRGRGHRTRAAARLRDHPDGRGRRIPPDRRAMLGHELGGARGCADDAAPSSDAIAGVINFQLTDAQEDASFNSDSETAAWRPRNWRVNGTGTSSPSLRVEPALTRPRPVEIPALHGRTPER